MNVSKRQQGTGVSVPEPRRASALLRRGGVVVVARHTSLISSSNEMTFTRTRVDRSEKIKKRFGSEQEREIGTESDSEREIRVNDLL